jgi:rRNA maturation protein Nop10
MQDTCPRCGSGKIVPAVPLLDHYGDLGVKTRTAEVQVQGEPGAWIFKDAVTGTLTIDVCGECGHAELRVGNFRELYEKHRKSLGQ